jgi:hypothetical protein
MKAKELLEQLNNIDDNVLLKVSIEYSSSTDETEVFITAAQVDEDLETIFLLNDELSFARA